MSNSVSCVARISPDVVVAATLTPAPSSVLATAVASSSCAARRQARLRRSTISTPARPTSLVARSSAASGA